MIIEFKNISIHNFLSIGDANIELKDQGYTLISGINNNPSDNAKSNGSGKSSISEAILWSLTGETFRGVKDVTNIYTTGGTSVELNFKIDNKDYTIIRYRNHKEYGNNLKIIIDGKDVSGKGIRDSENILKQYLPDISTQLIGSVIILGQGLPQRFSNNTPSGRKEILERLSKSDFMIEDIKSRLGTRKIELNTQLRKVEDTLLQLNTQKDFLESNINKYQVQLDNLQNSYLNNSFIENIKKIKVDIEINNLDIEKYINTREDYLKRLKDIEESILNSTKEENDSLNELNNSYNSRINELKEQIYSLKSSLNSLNAEISRLENITDICPTCGQKIPGVIKPDTSSQREQKDEYEIKLLELNDQLKELQSCFSGESFLIKNKFESKLKELNNKKLEINNLKANLQKGIDEKDKIKTDLLLKLKEIEALQANYESQKLYFIQTINESKNNLTRISQEILYNNSENDLINEKLSVINKMITIVTRDFRGFLLTNVIEFINNKVKEYSKEVFNNDKIDFTLDGNNININYDGRQLENLSGGERQKIDIIIQLALRDMLVQYLNFNSNILFIDEIFDNLDITGCDEILNLISNKSNNIESLFIITHHSQELSIPYDNEIIIEKNSNGISYIK